MHIPLIKALVAVISASALAIGVALAPAAAANHRSHNSASARPANSLASEAVRFVGQLEAGLVKPDPALKQIWKTDVTAVAHSLGISDSALAQELSQGHSLAQIAAMHGVPAGTPTTVLVRHLREHLDEAEHDQSISPTAANALLDALTTALGHP
jgi:transposase-like protein